MRVLDAFEPTLLSIHAVSLTRTVTPPKVTDFVDCTAAEFKGGPIAPGIPSV